LVFLCEEGAIKAQIFMGEEDIVVEEEGVLDKCLEIGLGLGLNGEGALHLLEELVHLAISEIEVVQIAGSLAQQILHLN
jgi:hypothetical protein